MRSTRDVILESGDLRAVRAHYHGVLGFPVVVDEEHLVGFDTGAFTLYFESGIETGPVFEFDTENFEADKHRLLAAGCVLVDENPEIPRCYMLDPFGLTFNLNESG
jgi:catechol 2,3-dioxygenase-like lactoylglutathione lyase family enzyme